MTNQNSNNRAKSIILLNANDKANKLETVPFDITNEKVKDIFKKSRMPKLRKKLGKMLSLKGKAALAIIPYKDSYILDVMEIVEFDLIGSNEIRVRCFNGSTIIRDGVEVETNSVYYFDENNIPTLSTYAMIKSKMGTVTEELINEYKFNMTRLPLEMFENNEDRVSDIEYSGLEGQLKLLEKLDNDMFPEWNRSRTILSHNTSFIDGDPANITYNLDSGKKPYLENDSMNGKLGGGTQINAATGGVQLLQQTILSLEDDIYKKLYLKRDLTGLNNKHTFEVVLNEQYSFENLAFLREIRESHWHQFFSKLAELLNIPEFYPELKIAPIEQAKIDLLESSVVEAKMATDNVSSQVEANDIESEE